MAGGESGAGEGCWGFIHAVRRGVHRVEGCGGFHFDGTRQLSAHLDFEERDWKSASGGQRNWSFVLGWVENDQNHSLPTLTLGLEGVTKLLLTT